MAKLQINNVDVITETGGVATIASATKFPAGMIINYQSQITTISAGQDLSTTYAVVTGSSISYTPPSSASYVMYEFNFISSGKDSRQIGHYKIQVDGTDIDSSKHTIGQEVSTGSGRGTSLNHIKHRLTTWSGAKTVRLMAREYSDSFEPILHQQYQFDGTAGGAFYYDPTLIIFSVT